MGKSQRSSETYDSQTNNISSGPSQDSSRTTCEMGEDKKGCLTFSPSVIFIGVQVLYIAHRISDLEDVNSFH